MNLRGIISDDGKKCNLMLKIIPHFLALGCHLRGIAVSATATSSTRIRVSWKLLPDKKLQCIYGYDLYKVLKNAGSELEYFGFFNASTFYANGDKLDKYSKYRVEILANTTKGTILRNFTEVVTKEDGM